MNLGEYITKVINDQGRRRVWVAEQADINYKTLVDRLINNRFEQVEDFLRIANVLGIDLNELKDKV
jgi:hypothetical protein